MQDGAHFTHVVWGGVEVSSDSKSVASSAPSSTNSSLKARLQNAKVHEATRRAGHDIDFRDEHTASRATPLSDCVLDDGSSVPSASERGDDEGRRAAPTSSANQQRDADTQQEGSGIGHWSVGSLLHDQGQCKPCHYVKMPGGCYNGKDCTFCHLVHCKSTRARPCKNKRQKWKRYAHYIEQMSETNPEYYAQAVQQAPAQSAYLHSLLSKPGAEDELAAASLGVAGAGPSSGAAPRKRNPRMLVSHESSQQSCKELHGM